MCAVLIAVFTPTLGIGADTGPSMIGLAKLAEVSSPSPSVLASNAAVNRRFFIKFSLYLRTLFSIIYLKITS
jgi:hypothetical protein